MQPQQPQDKKKRRNGKGDQRDKRRDKRTKRLPPLLFRFVYFRCLFPRSKSRTLSCELNQLRASPTEDGSVDRDSIICTICTLSDHIEHSDPFSFICNYRPPAGGPDRSWKSMFPKRNTIIPSPLSEKNECAQESNPTHKPHTKKDKGQPDPRTTLNRHAEQKTEKGKERGPLEEGGEEKRNSKQKHEMCHGPKDRFVVSGGFLLPSSFFLPFLLCLGQKRTNVRDGMLCFCSGRSPLDKFEKQNTRPEKEKAGNSRLAERFRSAFPLLFGKKDDDGRHCNHRSGDNKRKPTSLLSSVTGNSKTSLVASPLPFVHTTWTFFGELQHEKQTPFLARTPHMRGSCFVCSLL
mmetsp:Transcript_4958/g.10621  ORF Transcript_4958/g.10621 Transcript_4958/m.10621 type:complete len:349 (+) Transcript_4958:334-1380(+)